MYVLFRIQYSVRLKSHIHIPYICNQIILSDISNVPLFFHFVAFIQFNVIHTTLHIPLNLKLCERFKSNNPVLYKYSFMHYDSLNSLDFMFVFMFIIEFKK